MLTGCQLYFHRKGLQKFYTNNLKLYFIQITFESLKNYVSLKIYKQDINCRKAIFVEKKLCSISVII